ncbi:hypothetical protein ISS37_05920 [candidate division KSB1 bacterium]|nr:hypothetical protein [candidate division KSB1 bacterium]
MKRLLIPIILALAAGFYEAVRITKGGWEDVGAAHFWFIVTSRGLIGFMIGISRLKLHHTLHGVLMGLVGSLPIIVLFWPQHTVQLLLLSLAYGLMIEIMTTRIFKAPAHIPFSQKMPENIEY